MQRASDCLLMNLELDMSGKVTVKTNQICSTLELTRPRRGFIQLMLKASLKNPALRQRASQFTRLVRHSAVTPRTGQTHKPQLVSNGELGVTFIGHSSFFLQIGGQSV